MAYTCTLFATALLCLLHGKACSSQMNTTDCGVTKTCFTDPANCSISSPECHFISWKKSVSGDTYEFEMSGGAGDGREYIAMALGTAPRMMNADLYYCDGKAIRSGVIKEEHDDPTPTALQNGLVVKSAATVNGVAQCVLTRPRSITKDLGDFGELRKHNFDIKAAKYHLLVARGEMNEGELTYHDWSTFVEKPYNFSEPAPGVNTRSLLNTTTPAGRNDTGNITKPTTAVTTKPSATNQKLSADGCGTSKVCVRDPDNCDLSKSDCRFFSWKKSTTDGMYEFEMSGSAGNGAEYVAMGLGMSIDMKDADLYYCDGKAVHSGVIGALHKEPKYLTAENGLVTKSAGTVNGVAHCVFNRPQSVTKNISTGPHNFDIKANTYHLLGAVGATTKTGGMEKHTWKTSTQKYNFSSAKGITSSALLLGFAISLTALLSHAVIISEHN